MSRKPRKRLPREEEALMYIRMKALRNVYQLQQKFVAERLEIDQSTYSCYENGKLDPPIRVLSMLADLYHTSVDYMCGRTPEFDPYPLTEGRVYPWPQLPLPDAPLKSTRGPARKKDKDDKK